jgi:myo-inositol-1(or 4)-monophosphatase
MEIRMSVAIDDDEISHRLDSATRIARQAGEKALGYFLARDQLEIAQKAAQDRVSEADRAVETLIRDAILFGIPG